MLRYKVILLPQKWGDRKPISRIGYFQCGNKKQSNTYKEDPNTGRWGRASRIFVKKILVYFNKMLKLDTIALLFSQITYTYQMRKTF